MDPTLRLTGENVVVARRYRGPDESGNGGYVCGLVAEVVGGPAEVTLRLPPPLETPLAVARDDGRVALLAGEAVVAEGVAAEVEVELPRPVTWEEAKRAAREPIPNEEFPSCFVCGPLRERGDGLRIRPGQVRDGVVAAPWVAGEVSVPVVWAAVDCPGAYGIGFLDRGAIVLGRMAARVDRLPREGERCVALGWRIGEDGRKLYAGTALLGADGEPLAVARQTWIEPRR